MHGLIIQVRTVPELYSIRRLSVMFLLVHDVMLRTSNNTSILNTLNSLGNCNASQDWVGAEAFKICQSMC